MSKTVLETTSFFEGNFAMANKLLFSAVLIVALSCSFAERIRASVENDEGFAFLGKVSPFRVFCVFVTHFVPLSLQFCFDYNTNQTTVGEFKVGLHTDIKPPPTDVRFHSLSVSVCLISALCGLLVHAV